MKGRVKDSAGERSNGEDRIGKKMLVSESR
jgi:hypothetical protein